ncbi:hypothetical protein B0H17DRAFT_1092315 [Mycena rosella]|uniref:BTB domain-containing protein n=1 Tax=Mycena rosella TaxID=1033263 RepID=A0AAD7CV71_MYCRO|nr:hypothetical protein B0H17DRAFT_1092315 [Mycena rosella]
MHQYSKLFNAPDADVTFQSCDATLFGIHRANLQTNTEGFPPSEISTNGEIVTLSESSVTLELLFQFIYPRRHPTLDDIPFDHLSALAEAAEKYQVFSAMSLCCLYMRDVLPDHAPEVLAYAAKHDYPTLVYEAAPFTFDIPLAEVVGMLPQYLVLPWVRYFDAWNAVLHDAIAVRQRTHYNTVQSSQCRFWKVERPPIAQQFGHSLRSLRRLHLIFADQGTKLSACCEEAKKLWRAEIEDAMNKIPPFASFV